MSFPLRFSSAVLALLLALPAFAADYVPPRHDWQRRAPAEMGFDPEALAAAVAHAREQAVVEPADLRQVLNESFGSREPDYRILGPVAPRGQASGVIVRGGYIVAEWGDLARPDMTFSVAKSYLATVAGLAVDDGAIASVDDPVARYLPGPWFEGPHNGAITWAHLLHQTSDWSGTLWEVADWAATTSTTTCG
jgi:CubicO group peptidase (beta-lactamase class C family)